MGPAERRPVGASSISCKSDKFCTITGGGRRDPVSGRLFYAASISRHRLRRAAALAGWPAAATAARADGASACILRPSRRAASRRAQPRRA
eukprot:1933546-Pyramimonas_sp.AAC.1